MKDNNFFPARGVSIRTMTIILAIACLGLLLTSGCRQQEQVEEVVEQPEEAGFTHNARTSLDYTGTYRGKIPNASGELQETIIELNDDGTVVKTTKQPGQEENSGFETYTAYTWNTQGNVITLNALPPPNSYFVSEGYLVHLDENMSQLNGKISEVDEDYILRKE